MKLRLKNIGIVKDSAINIDGLTVILGENNSGKTTVGKTLYSIIQAVENLEENFIRDKKEYASEKVVRIINSLFIRSSGQSKKLLEDYSFFIKKISRCHNLDDVRTVIEEFKNTILAKRKAEGPMPEDKIVFDISAELLRILDKLIEDLDSDPQLTGYANLCISKELRNVFYNQIQPVKAKTEQQSMIELTDGTRDYYRIPIKNNEVSSKSAAFLNPAFDECFFITGVDVLNDTSFYHADKEDFVEKYMFDVISRKDSCDRNTILANKLRRSSNNVFEEILNNQRIEKINELIKKAIPDDVYFVKNKLVVSKHKLDARNLAEGSKMFAILKMLLGTGDICRNTLVILDEPENHMHPKWQKIFAEVIVLFIKHLGCKIVLTTHSPTFLLALETYSKIHGIKKDFYLSEKKDDQYMVDFTCINNDTNRAYAAMSEPYLELDVMYGQGLMKRK